MRQFTLFLAAAFLVGAAVALQEIRVGGGSRCTWGPTYWCGGFRQSRECGATTHCIDNVWSQMRLPEDNDEVCDICKNMVAEARDTLVSNETQEELKEVFEGSCALIPIKIIRKECDVIVDEFVPELVETLSSEMNPDLVCATAGLCNSARIDNLLNSYYASNPHKTECQVCKMEARKMKRKLRELLKGDVEDKLFEVCGHLGSYSDACRATVQDNFDAIYSTLYHFNEAELCDATGLCSETLNRIPAVYQSTRPNDVQCEFCEKVIKHWVDTWTANTTEIEFKQVLDSLCHKLARPARVTRCLHLVDDWYLPWFNFLLHEVNAHQICQMAGLCGAGGFMKVNDRSPITLLLPALGNEHHSAELEETNELAEPRQRLIGGYFIPQTALIAEKPGCVICEFAVTHLDEYLENNKTKDAVEAAIYGLCHRMPKSVKDQCSNLVGTYGPALIQMIVSNLHPKEICARLSLCPRPNLVGENPTALLDHQASLPDEIMVSKWKDDTCALCEFVMTEVIQGLNDPSDQRMVKNLLESVCYRLPDSVENSCVKMVDEYSSMIMTLIANNADAGQVCSKLQMCEKAYLDILTPKAADEECTLCEMFISKLDATIEDKSNVEEIKEAVEKICTVLPSSVTRKCKKYVEEYGDLIINLIAQGIDPEQVCTQLGLCDNVIVTPTKSDQKCTLCEMLISKLDATIEDKSNEEELKKYFENICSYMPSSVAPSCKKYVEEYGDAVIDMIAQGLDPEQVCTEIGLCNNIIVAPTKSDQECTLCEMLISKLDATIEDKGNEEELKKYFEQICSYMPSSVAPSCKKYVEEYGDAVIDLIAQGLDPEQVCTELGLCKKALIAPIIKSDQECTLCEVLISKLDATIEDKGNEGEIKDYFEKICSYMPSSVAPSCKKYVDEYADQIIALIAQGLDPQQVCTELGLCKKAAAAAAAPTKSAQECALCEFAITTLDNILGDRKSAEAVKEALDELCSYLPKTVTAQCVKYVDTYSEMIIDLISHDLPPQQVCSAIGLCQQESLFTVLPAVMPNSASDEGPLCTLCEYAIGDIDRLITDPHNEAEVKEALDHVCYELSAPVKNECLRLINAYAEELIRMITNKYTPEEICKEIRMCSPRIETNEITNNEIPPMETELIQVPAGLSSKTAPYCSICEFALHIIESKLLTNRTFDMAERAIQMACNLMPQSVAVPCENFVDKYGDEIIEAIIELEINPKAVCSALTLCAVVDKPWDARALGGRRCAFGPSYWCRTPFHARQCGTTRHCQIHVWNN